MKKLLSIFVFLAWSIQADAVYCYASVTGNWNQTATWGGSAVPVPGDIVLINGDIVVTIPAGVTASCALISIGQTSNTTGIATLINNGTLTNTDQLRVGGTAAGFDGKLILGPGSITTAANGGVYLNLATIRSTATRNNPASVVVTGGISTLATGPRQDIQVSNVSFQVTNSIAFPLQNTVGAATSTFVITNCTFQGNRDIIVGSTDTPSSTIISITGCDFREFTVVPQITIQRTTGGAAVYEFLRNTVSQSAASFSLITTTSSGLTISGNVFYNVQITGTAATGNTTISNNVFCTNLAVQGFWSPNDGDTGGTFTYNYCLCVNAGDNTHPVVPVAGSSGGSGTRIVTYNILNGPTYTGHDKPDLIVASGSGTPVTLTNNIVISAGEIAVGTHAAAWAVGFSIKNNTISGTESSAVSGVGHLFDPEGVPTTGAVTIANNLVYGNGRVGDVTVVGTLSGAPQVVAYSNYGVFFNIATPYGSGTQLTVTAGNTGLTVPAANETTSNPRFFGQTRDASQWNKYFGNGTATADAAIAFLLTINGYRGTPNFDQQGTATAYTPRQMLDWVAYGFSPTNTVLRGAGNPTDGSPDIGAMPVRTIAGTFF